MCPLQIPISSIPEPLQIPSSSIPEYLRIGATLIIPFIEEGSDLETDCQQIFNCRPQFILPDNICYPKIFPHNLISDFPEFSEIRLPRVYHPASSLSDHTLILVFDWRSFSDNGTIVFAFDPISNQLYHIVTKHQKQRYPFGAIDSYAALKDNVYFVGGCHYQHDVNLPYEEAMDDLRHVRGMTWDLSTELAGKITDLQNKKYLEVESFNLFRGKWEENSKFNVPKHCPFVFTFNRKIFAIAVKPSRYNLGNRFPSFEFLDTSKEDVTSVSHLEERSNSGSHKEESCSVLSVEVKEESWSCSVPSVEEETGGSVSSVEEETGGSVSSMEEETGGGVFLMEELKKEMSSIFAPDSPTSPLHPPFLIEDHSSSESVDSSRGSPITWSLLPKPPFVGVEDTGYVFCKEKNCLFVKVSDNLAEGHISLIWKFDVVSEKWYNTTTDTSDSFYDPEDYEFLNSLTQVPAKHFEGCIVHKILFYFEEDKRWLVGHDLRGKKVFPRKWEIELDHLLRNEGRKTMSSFRLCHFDGFKFCIVINYQPSYDWNVNLLCICTFELSLHQEDDFIPTPLGRLYFQLPNHGILVYHTKFEDRHDSGVCRRI